MGKGNVICQAAHRVGLPGNMGLKATAIAVAARMGRDVPGSRKRQWELLREFVGEHYPVTYRRSASKPWRASAVSEDAFLGSYAWRRLRMEALKLHGRCCQCCGARPEDGVRMHVDHIKPRRLFPELALVLSNLQVLCEDCNHGKGNWDQTDWRPAHEPISVTRDDWRILLSDDETKH